MGTLCCLAPCRSTGCRRRRPDTPCASSMRRPVNPVVKNGCGQALGGVARVDVSPMPLKAILMALARTFRSEGPANGNRSGAARPGEERRR